MIFYRSFGVRFYGPFVVVSFVVLFLALFGEGCGAAGAKRFTVGYLGWDENVANSAVVAVLAEDEFGYVVDLRRARDVKPAFDDVASGKTDAFMDVWMPAHKEFLRGRGDEMDLSEEPWYVGRTEFGLAVPDYMEKTRSIADLNGSGARMITGIEPGALIMKEIQNKTIPEYGLELALVESSTPVMLSELGRSYGRQEPFVFIAWSPHWMNTRYGFRYLEDPKGSLADVTMPSRLYSVYRRGLDAEDPVAYALMDSMRLTEKQVNTISLYINRAGSPEKGARRWVAENPGVVDPWLDAASAAGGTG